MDRILGIDYGDARTGIAISDPMGIIATPQNTIITFKDEQIILELVKIIEENNVKKIILGYPKNMNGSEGIRAEKTKEFRKKIISSTNVYVIMWDERLTSVSAHRTLSEANVRGEKRKKAIDKMAACLILQNYLDSIN